MCISAFRTHRKVTQQITALEAELSEANRVRDAKANQLAPFEAMARQQFPNAPRETQLALLLQRIETVTALGAKSRGRRYLDAEAITRIRSKLDLTPGLDIEIGGVLEDSESLALAEQLKSVFEGAGFKVRKLAQYLPSSKVPSGVSIYSRHELNEVLGSAIGQIFTELSQQPMQWIAEDLAGTESSSEPQPELKIIVGRQ